MRKEPTQLGVSKDREENYSGFREPDWPSCGGKRTKHPDQKRQSGKTEAFFEKGQKPAFTVRKVTHPSRTAERQRSWMEVSDTEHTPSDRKIMTGALSCRSVKTKELHKGRIQDCEPLCAPVLFHHSLACSESCRKIRIPTSLVAKDGP